MGGILVGDASDYSTYVALTKSDDPLEVTPAELAVGITTPGGAGGAGNDVADMPDAAQVRAVTNYICYFTMSCMSSYHRVGHPVPVLQTCTSNASPVQSQLSNRTLLALAT